MPENVNQSLDRRREDRAREDRLAEAEADLITNHVARIGELTNAALTMFAKQVQFNSKLMEFWSGNYEAVQSGLDQLVYTTKRVLTETKNDAEQRMRERATLDQAQPRKTA